jgi:carbon starvation protein
VAGDPELAGLEFTFHQGGAVAAASILYLGLAIVMGVVDRFLHPPLWLQTAIFVPATIGAVALGPVLADSFVLPADFPLAPVQVFSLGILLYCGIASLLPVWLLLQPRGYLGGFVLYLALAVGVYGILFGNFEIQSAAYKPAEGPDARTALLFPFLFVTIACGACSGFHGLVCSGTTSKQIANETHCRPVGYGAMLLEGLVALIALATVMIAAPAAIAGKPAGSIYGTGLGRFLAGIIGQEYLPVAITFGAMAFSTFVFDTLDVSTRLGRYVLEELVGRRNRTTAIVATAVMIGVPLSFVLLAGPGAYLSFWTLFGTSNQLLAALSLLGISVWLRRSGRRFAYVLVPAVFISAVTLSALVLVLVKPFTAAAAHTLMEGINSIVALVLLALACSLMGMAGRALLRPLEGEAVGSPGLAAAAGSAPR